MHYNLRDRGQMRNAAFASILMLLILSEFAYARVSGTCSNCHTMHNSQNASSMVSDPIASQGVDPNCTTCHEAPRAVLLRMNCLGCHAKETSGPSNIIQISNSYVPQVGHHDTVELAGGNYRHVYDPSGDDRKGHNVHGFSGISDDSFIFNNPPGYKDQYDPSLLGYEVGSELRVMCAGQNGCHGDRDYTGQLQAIKGAHHTDDTILKFGAGFTETGQGGTVGKSYRFLYKVHGAEDNDWQDTLGPTDHNEYKGSIYGDRTSQSWNDITTISQLCAECHGYFHASGSGGIGSGASPWLRHPTDVVLPDSGEYSAYTAYSTEAPVARQNINGTGGASGTVDPDTDIVMCLSCHRAHASQFFDILRWDYSTMVAGGGGSGGCFTCHTQKDISP